MSSRVLVEAATQQVNEKAIEIARFPGVTDFGIKVYNREQDIRFQTHFRSF